jgi:hypothetical protein
LSLRTYVGLILGGQNAELAAAHDELYPERVAEHIPLSITLLYPWIPVDDLADADLDGLSSFLAARPTFEFELTRVAEFPGAVVYAVPEPDDELRGLMRALWARYPDLLHTGKPAAIRRRTPRWRGSMCPRCAPSRESAPASPSCSRRGSSRPR